MALFGNKNERDIPEESARLVQSVPPRQTSTEIMLRQQAGKFDSTFGVSNLPPGWAVGENKDVPGLSRLGYHGEAAQHAWYQAIVSPWMTTPAGVAAANILANAVAKLPLRMVNKKTNEVRDLPQVFDYPLSRMYNPTFNNRDHLKMITMNLLRYGTSHILSRYKAEKTIMMRPLDSLTVRTNGSFTRPTWTIIGHTSTWFAGNRQLYDPDLPELNSTIYPDGRLLEDQSMPAAEWGMMLITINRTPGSNNGVPPGLLTYDATIAATEAQRHAADFFKNGTWEHLFVSPNVKLEDLSTLKEANENIKESLAGNHRATIAPLPYDVKPVGFSASDSQLVQSREADMMFSAISYGLPAGTFAMKGQSFAQVYADQIRKTEEAVLPICCEIEDEHTRALTLAEQDAGWVVEFDRSAMKNLDPKTAADIATMLRKDGDITGDEVREATGYVPFEKEWSSVPLADGNRKPVDKLAALADAQIEKQKAPTGKPGEGGGTDKPEYPAVPS